MSEKKLVVSDIDGTLLDSSRRLPRENIEAVRELIRQGHMFAIATGRIFGTARMVAQEFGDDADMYIISCAGAEIRNTADSLPIYLSVMDKNLVARIAEIAESHGYSYQVYTEMSMVSKRPNPFLERYVAESLTLPEYLRYDVDMHGSPLNVEGIQKVAITFYDKALTDELLRDLDALKGINYAHSHRHGIDILPSGTDKGTALRRLAEHLNVNIENTYAIGDEDNDVVLLNAAGTGIAMANASESTKRAARAVTLSNDEAGVAAAIYRYVLGK